jgi:hypothetical protein
MTWRLSVTGWIVFGAALSSPVLAAPKPVVTNKTHFRIPFRFDSAALQRMNARELRLYVSSDGGQRWDLAQTIGTEAGKFEFQAPGDGEYRFAVKTLDGKNQLHPPGDLYETGLIVSVDTEVPQLAIDARSDSAGKVLISWRATDANLDLGTLRLEYTQPGVDDWQAVSIVPQASGQTSWSVPTGGVVAVRGTVADLAGNQGQAQTQAQIEPARSGNAAPKPDPRQPIAESATPALAAQQPDIDHFADEPPGLASPGQKSRTKLPQITPIPPVVEREAVVITPRTHLTSDQTQKRPDITQDRWSPITEPELDPAQTAPDPDPLPGNTSPRQRLVNARKFQVGYQVDDVGSSGISSVELFITQDRGKKWWKYGDDADHQSPIDVEVPQDGEYGFAIRARSGVGLANDPPRDGDAPDLMVVVDQTPPAIELLPVRQGKGAQINQLQLRWRISEAHPDDKPVALFYAGSPEGPWEELTSWQADTGEYVWTVGANMPPLVYFRIVARDAAGNTAHAQTPRAIVVDLSRPSARIVDVETPSSGPQ